MRKTVYICDECKKEIHYEDVRKLTVAIGKYPDIKEEPEISKDLHHDCLSKVLSGLLEEDYARIHIRNVKKWNELLDEKFRKKDEQKSGSGMLKALSC